MHLSDVCANMMGILPEPGEAVGLLFIKAGHVVRGAKLELARLYFQMNVRT